MDCPLKLVVRKCDKCPFGKEGLCDFPYARSVHRRRRSYDIAVVMVEFKWRLEEMLDDIANGRITFRNPPQEWTDELLARTVLRCTLCKIQEESRWN